MSLMGGRNAWRTLEEMATENRKYKSFDAEMSAGLMGVNLTESMYTYGGDEF